MPYYRYAEDLTGVNPDNLVVGEVITLTNNPIRVAISKYAPFYVDSLVLYDNVNQRPLTKGVDYRVPMIVREATLQTGMEVADCVLIENSAVSSSIRFTAQVLGGDWQNNISNIAAIYESFLNDNRSVDWSTGIYGKPDGFPPSAHPTWLADIFGFGPFVAELERIAKAIELTNTPAFEALVDWFRTQNAAFQTQIDSANAAIIAEANARHAADLSSSQDIAAEALIRLQQDNMKVSQGAASGGIGQLNNKVIIGWSATGLKATVDSTDLGNFVFTDMLVGKYLPITGGTITGPLTINTPLGTQPLLEQRGGSTGGVAYYDNNDPDGGIYSYGFQMDTENFYFRMSTVDGQHALDGAIKAYLTKNGAFVATGDVYAYSDPVLKDDVKRITNAVELCKQLDGVTFIWNDRSEITAAKVGKRDYGVLADQVEKIMPEIVSLSVPEGESRETFRIVAYDKMVPVLLEAIKELNERIEVLENRMNFIQKTIKLMEGAVSKVNHFFTKV